MISTRDWVDAVVHLAETDTVSGPVNLCCEQVPTNAEFTRELAHQVHRPAFFRVPLRRSCAPLPGEMAPELLGSVNAYPQPCWTAGSCSATPTSAPCCARGWTPQQLTHR